MQFCLAQNCCRFLVSRTKTALDPFWDIFGKFFHGPNNIQKCWVCVYFPWWSTGSPCCYPPLVVLLYFFCSVGLWGQKGCEMTASFVSSTAGAIRMQERFCKYPSLHAHVQDICLKSSKCLRKIIHSPYGEN